MIKKLLLYVTHSEDKTYAAKDVAKIHNRYRLAIFILIVVFIWVLASYGNIPDLIRDVTLGKVIIQKDISPWAILVNVAKWVASFFTVAFGIVGAIDKFVKKVEIAKEEMVDTDKVIEEVKTDIVKK